MKEDYICMSTTREQFHDTYKTILGRNNYNQDRREYVFKTYGSTGKYYSDCSSSICAVNEKIGIKGMRDGGSLLNTEGMHYAGKKVNVDISNGHIVKGIENLRVGDCLMFRGNDPSRPLQIGHVEAIYEINGKTESDIVICGHGSGTPSTKNMKTYLSRRESSKASNGKTKGLVEVLRFIDDSSESPKKPSPSKEGYPVIYKGYKDQEKGGSYCKLLQEDINYLGYRDSSGKLLAVDGHCGARTEEAIKKLQKGLKEQGIYDDKIDGRCGANTWNAINKRIKTGFNVEVLTSLNCRDYADIQAMGKVLHVCKKGDKLKVSNWKPGWYYIPKLNGFVSSKYVKKI